MSRSIERCGLKLFAKMKVATGFPVMSRLWARQPWSAMMLVISNTGFSSPLAISLPSISIIVIGWVHIG